MGSGGDTGGDSRRRRIRFALLIAAALVLVGAGAYQYWAPVLAVAPDAQAGARLLAAHDLRADFAPASLWDVDRYLEDGAPGEGAREQKLRELGAYVGEALRLKKGGKWIASPEAPGGVELELPDATRCSPHGRVARRIDAGREGGIAVYAQSLGLDVRPVPDWWLARPR
jgi:hypothetical protein